MAFYSCRYFEDPPPNHPAYISKSIAKAEQMYDTKQASQYLDSVLLTIKPGYEDLYMVNFFKQRKYTALAAKENRSTNLNRALVYADSMAYWVNQDKNNGDYPEQLAQCYLAKGDVLFEMKYYSLAFKNYFLGKAQLKNIQNSGIRINYRLANIYYGSGKYTQAAAAYLQACKDEVNGEADFMSFSYTQTFLDNVGLSYAKAGMADSAKFYYRKALNFIEDHEIKFKNEADYIKCAKGIVYGNLAEVYYEEYNYSEAELYFKKSLAFNARPHVDLNFLQGTRMGLALMYLDLRKMTSAKAIIDTIKLDVAKFPNDLPKLRWHKLQIKYLMQTGDYEKAKQLVSAYHTLNRKFIAAKTQVTNIDLDADFFNLQKAYELNVIKKDKQVTTLYLALAATLTIACLIILFQLWRSWQISKSNNNGLTKLNNQLNEQNVDLQQMLYELNKGQEEHKKILGVIAHDLRSPIGAIVSAAGIMVDNHKLTAEDYEMISLIKSSGSDSLKFIDELLRKDHLNLALEKEEIELNAFLNYCIGITKHKATEKNQNIVLASEKVNVKLNREKMWRVVSNLIGNAIKFSPEKKIIKVESYISIDHITIAVKDEGMGIPKDIRDKIFDLNHVKKRAGTEGEPSFGMGLVISKQIVEAHGGRIWLENNDFGSTFFVELPK